MAWWLRSANMVSDIIFLSIYVQHAGALDFEPGEAVSQNHNRTIRPIYDVSVGPLCFYAFLGKVQRLDHLAFAILVPMLVKSACLVWVSWKVQF